MLISSAGKPFSFYRNLLSLVNTGIILLMPPLVKYIFYFSLNILLFRILRRLNMKNMV